MERSRKKGRLTNVSTTSLVLMSTVTKSSLQFRVTYSSKADGEEKHRGFSSKLVRDGLGVGPIDKNDRCLETD
jgi:hypothetical protein